MAGMKRFVTYIYVYEEKKKGNNVGFAKIEIRGEDCRVEIHLRGIYVKNASCRVYLFRESQSQIEGVRIGEMHLINGNGDFATVIKARHIGESDLDINNIEGIFLLTEDGGIFMSRWKEGNPLDVCRENFREWMPPTQSQMIQDAPHLQEKQTEQENHTKQEERPAEEIHVTQDVRPEQNVQATEIPMRNIFPVYEWEDIWETLKTNRTVYQPFQDREAECIQIELKNLRELPQKYWYLGNNSFLLHGFFNYQYIVIGRNGEGRWFIGVPGVYQQQERVMAVIFGFTDFIAVAGDELKKEEPMNRFGCWCRYIEE